MLRDLTDAARLEVGELRLAASRWSSRPSSITCSRSSRASSTRPASRTWSSPELPPLDVDPDRLDRILVNLFGNALKYSDGEVQVAAERDGDSVRITVADRGAGIPPGDLPRLFERYYRGLRHEGEGLGLGLFIVKGLVEAHGGAIEVASVPGEGSTFTLGCRWRTAPGPAHGPP